MSTTMASATDQARATHLLQDRACSSGPYVTGWRPALARVGLVSVGRSRPVSATRARVYTVIRLSQTPNTYLSGRSTSTEPCFAPARRRQPVNAPLTSSRFTHFRLQVVRGLALRPLAGKCGEWRTSPRHAATSRRRCPAHDGADDADHGPAHPQRVVEADRATVVGPDRMARAFPRLRDSREEVRGRRPLGTSAWASCPCCGRSRPAPACAVPLTSRHIPGLRLGRVLHRDQALVEHGEVDHRLGAGRPLALVLVQNRGVGAVPEDRPEPSTTGCPRPGSPRSCLVRRIVASCAPRPPPKPDGPASGRRSVR